MTDVAETTKKLKNCSRTRPFFDKYCTLPNNNNEKRRKETRRT